VAVLTSNAAAIRGELADLEERGARDFQLDVTAARAALETGREERAKADARATAMNEKVSAVEDQLSRAVAGRWPRWPRRRSPRRGACPHQGDRPAGRGRSARRLA
jgi:hypothetical protein